jgi:hypothetical protein
MAGAHAEAVEVRLQPGLTPALPEGPFAGSLRDGDAVHGSPLALADQDIAVTGHAWLNDAGVRRQRVLPELSAIGPHRFCAMVLPG